METATMTYEVAQAKDFEHDWIVEAIDFAGEGEVFMTRFTGPNAESRAQEYATWKNEGGGSCGN